MQNRPYLLLQIRNAEDPMRYQEVECFSRVLQCNPNDIRVHNLLAGEPAPAEYDACQIILLGGSGDYSAAGEGDWLERILDVLRQIHGRSQPTFASCWGFQAMARALGGQVVHDLSRAELGTINITKTAAADQDPIFVRSPAIFPAQMGHEDLVIELPLDAVRLGFSERVEHQAFRFSDKPIYCTQFHPELDLRGLMERVIAYPKYIRKIAGISVEEFRQQCQETPAANEILRRFVQHVHDEW